MISIFPLWTLHLYVAIFLQHLHMEYLSLRWYDIPKLVVLSGYPWYRVAANKEVTESRIPFGKVEVITSNILRSPPWLGWSLFVLLYFFFWPLCCLFFFDILILITLLVSSISSWNPFIEIVKYFCLEQYLNLYWQHDNKNDK
jgi:hypothetical protein